MRATPCLSRSRCSAKSSGVKRAGRGGRPANLCKAFGVDGALCGADLIAGPLRILDAPRVPPRKIKATPRIGVDYAGEDALRPWRFVVSGSPSLSVKA